MAVPQSATLQGIIVNVIVMLILVVWIENFRNSSKGYCKKIACTIYIIPLVACVEKIQSLFIPVVFSTKW